MEERYSRQILFAPIGLEGQEKLANKHVLIIGAGALGTGNAEALVRAGLGKLTIVDRDYVEWSNLQRQQLYEERDACERIPKAVAIKNHLLKINSNVNVDAHIIDVTPLELLHLAEGVDLMVDATDNFDIRMIINDVSQKQQIPWIYGSCAGSYAISFTIIPDETPCLHCLMENVPVGGMTCDKTGIIQPAVGMAVVQQTTEALKILTDNYKVLRKKLISFDVWNNQQAAIDVTQMKKEDCPSCGKHRTYPFLNYNNQLKTAVLCGRDTVQIRPAHLHPLDLNVLAEDLAHVGGEVEQNPFLISFRLEHLRIVVFQDGRALIHGTNDVTEAKKFYYRYIG